MPVIHALIIAFATYSRIPVPRIEWTDENRRYAMCFFPLIGAVIGLVMAAWLWVCGALAVGPVLQGAVGALIPLLMTGGIHRFLHILSVFSARYPPFPQASPRWLTAEVASVRVGTTFGFIARNRTCPDTSRRQSSGRNANWRPACNLSVIAGVPRHAYSR